MVFGEPRLLERFRAGDEEALRIVYAGCVDHVTRVAGAVLRACAAGTPRGAGDVAAALADVVQEVFVKAFAPEARQRFDGSRLYEPYLAQIARNAAIDHWRQMSRYVPSDLEQLIERLSFEAASDDSTNAWADRETVAIVDRYVAALDDESRRIHDALYVKGLSQREAAAALGLGRQVIRTTEAKLRSGLRRELSRTEKPVAMALPPIVSKQRG